MAKKLVTETVVKPAITRSKADRANAALLTIQRNNAIIAKAQAENKDATDELLALGVEMVDDDNRTAFPGVVIKTNRALKYDKAAALEWVLKLENLFRANAALTVNLTGIGKLVAMLVASPDLMREFVEAGAFDLNETGYGKLIRDNLDKGSFKSMPEVTVDETLSVSITKDAVKVGDALFAELNIVPDEAVETDEPAAE